jgi:hypothetical protein
MNPAEIEALISGLILIIQLVSDQLGASDKLTDEEKAAFVARIKAVQLAVPDWE